MVAFPSYTAEGGVNWACTGAVHKLVDENVLGLAHMGNGGETSSVYWTDAFDKYGILNAFITACIVSIVGMTIVGRTYATFHVRSHHGSIGYSPRADIRLVLIWLALGIVLAGLGLHLHTQGVIPIVPAMMTPSFCFWTSGTGLTTLAVLYALMGTPCACPERHWPGYPFVYMGRNPLLVYAGHVILKVKLTGGGGGG